MVVIEHNLDVIKTADWLIDMGPEGGSRGGMIIAEGTPEQITANPDSYTGDFLRPQPDLIGFPPDAVATDGRSPASVQRESESKAPAKNGPAKKISAKKARAATSDVATTPDGRRVPVGNAS